MAVGSVPALQAPTKNQRKQVLELLTKAADLDTQLDCGLSARIERQAALLGRIEPDRVFLKGANFEPQPNQLLRFSFVLDGLPYCFEAAVRRVTGGEIELVTPQAIYRDERRSRERAAVTGSDAASISLRVGQEPIRSARATDISPEGMSFYVPASTDLSNDAANLVVTRGGEREYGTLRYRKPAAQADGWIQVGIELRPTKPRPVANLDIEKLCADERLPHRKVASSVSYSASVLGAAIDRAALAARLVKTPPVNVVDFATRQGAPIRGILDSWGNLDDAVAVIIPPAWGRTKETLLPLASTIVSAFRKARQPIAVLRFDGVGKRGESYREPGAQAPGHECVRMRFSQGVDDIQGAVDFLHTRGRPRKTFVVSFSAASIEARRAVSRDDRIDGWVCVVGSADLQSMMKKISGGIDFALGIERGASFGIQEILGVKVDMDLAGRDALDHDLVYMSDARADMAMIEAPVTWIHGRADAWMDLGRVEDILSQGDTSNRRLVGTSMGHMLRSSSEALAVFQFVASELSRMGGGTKRLRGSPSFSQLARQHKAERARRPRLAIDQRQFWRDYLLGGAEGVGYELLTAISPFASMMKVQTKALSLAPQTRVLDLGAGTGAFVTEGQQLSGAHVVEVDVIREALLRGRACAEGHAGLMFIEADLQGRPRFPLATGSVDAVLASLFLSYVPNTEAVLSEITRVLRPGGRLVASTLIKDADMSKLFVEGVEELRRMPDSRFGLPSDTALRQFTNHASRLLDLEEEGAFRFWDPEEFRRLFIDQGWKVESMEPSFGDPPQAVVVTAVRGK
ncbi:MAG: class I SAM-dependent methyltransferase [Myxococcales bacterium]|nr:class I SAM-dependent methyltransferase [Myxococcales bacterium]